jgi:hypothetical protein
MVHDSYFTGYPGKNLTYALLSRQFFWPNAAREVRQILSNCAICKRTTIWRERKKGLLKPLLISERAFAEILIDFITDLPITKKKFTNCLVVMDRLIKAPLLQGMGEITAETTAKRLYETFYPYYGIPRAITSDRRTQFVSDVWRYFCKLLNIKQKLSTAYHPQTNGQTERMNQKIEKILRIFVNYAQDDWKNLLPIVQAALMNRNFSFTGLSPFFFLHDYYIKPIKLINNRVIRNRLLRPSEKVAEDAIKRLHEVTEWAQASMAAAQERQERYINRNRDPAFVYKPGDMVWLNLRNIRISRISKKLDWTYGRYRVVKKISSHAYELDVSGKIHPVFHVDLLRPDLANPRPSQVQDDTRPRPVLVGDHEEYAVEKILDVYTKGKHKKDRAIVKWIGYAKPIDEPLEFVKNTDAYEEFLRLKKGGR